MVDHKEEKRKLWEKTDRNKKVKRMSRCGNVSAHLMALSCDGCVLWLDNFTLDVFSASTDDVSQWKFYFHFKKGKKEMEKSI